MRRHGERWWSVAGEVRLAAEQTANAPAEDRVGTTTTEERAETKSPWRRGQSSMRLYTIRQATKRWMSLGSRGIEPDQPKSILFLFAQAGKATQAPPWDPSKATQCDAELALTC